VFCSNSSLVPSSDFNLNLVSAVLQFNPYNFKTLYLFNHNSVLSDFCAKRFVVTNPIYPLHHIADNTLFSVLFYLFCSIACLQPVDHQVESERSENFQDINFGDLEHQQAGIKGKCP
jgi:hypothetical protein